MTTGEKIKELRQQNKLTQEQFANSIMVSRRSVMDWEHDRYSPQTENLKEICRVYNLSLSYFLDSDNQIEEEIEAKDEALTSECINIVDNEKEANIEEFKPIRDSIYIDFKEKTRYKKEMLKNNRVYRLYKVVGHLAWLIPLILAFVLVYLNASDMYFNLIWIIPLSLYFLYKYLKNRYIVRVDEVVRGSLDNNKEALDESYPIYYEATKERLKIYNRNKLVVDAAAKDIKKISLSINNKMYLELLPKVDLNVYVIGMEIYYSDGKRSSIAFSFPNEDKVDSFMYSVCKIRLIDRLNKIYVIYKK